jgi:hypothetical protein
MDGLTLESRVPASKSFFFAEPRELLSEAFAVDFDLLDPAMPSDAPGKLLALLGVAGVP